MARRKWKNSALRSRNILCRWRRSCTTGADRDWDWRSFPYIDEQVYFADGNPAPNMDPEGILKAGQQMYAEMSKETKEFFDFMMENELFDVLGRKTKRAGGYMTYLPDYNAPFIFANFNGTSGDLDVITHECGHAFQGYISGKDPIQEHRDITMETAEIHSMSMEFLRTNGWSCFSRIARRTIAQCTGRTV